jgi:hypothetical protein
LTTFGWLSIFGCFYYSIEKYIYMTGGNPNSGKYTAPNSGNPNSGGRKRKK